MNTTRLIEFVFILNNNRADPKVGTFDVNEITSIVEQDKEHCLLTLKNGQQFLLCGILKTLTNRWIYTLERKIYNFHDEFARPSIFVYHKQNEMGVDGSFFDEYQLKQFIQALNPELFKTYGFIFE